jgi:hypothetical protein
MATFPEKIFSYLQLYAATDFPTDFHNHCAMDTLAYTLGKKASYALEVKISAVFASLSTTPTQIQMH